MSAPLIGQPVRRKEDFRFITGRGHYTDDFTKPGQSHAAFVRSPHAHARIVSIDTSEAGRDRVAFAPTTFQRSLHDSPGRRFFIVSGPVSYVCDPVLGTITRHWGYPLSAAQPTTFASGGSALIATRVSACDFDYAANVAPQVGLLTLRLTLSAPTSSGVAETVSLYHAVHVDNVP